MQLIGLVGAAVILGVAVLFSKNRSQINIRTVLAALAMQMVFCLMMLKTTTGFAILSSVAAGVQALQDFALEGSAFVFGPLIKVQEPWGFLFAFKVLPVIIFFSVLMSVLYHLGIIQVVVSAVARAIRPILATAGSETLSTVANCVLGQTEAPLLIKNYLPSMTRSQLLLVMISGMGHLSSAIVAAYASFGIPMVHLLTSAVISIPTAILIAKILLPESDAAVSQQADAAPARTTANVIDAIFSGTSDGVQLAVNIGAMLIAFIGLMAMLNFIFMKITLGVTGTAISFENLLGYLFNWVARLLGIAPEESVIAGGLIGKKLVINEFVAYIDLAKAAVSERTLIIMTYALAGFANFSSIGIQVGGIGALAPSKRLELTELGYRALLGGTLVTLFNAAIVSLFI